MPNYAPGTTDWEVGRERRLRHGSQRRHDFWGALAAVPGLLGAMTAVRQGSDARADDALLARRLAETYANPTGALPEGVSGPAYPPELQAAQEASAPDEGFWRRLARTATLGGAAPYQPRMTAQGVAHVGQAARAGRADQESQYRYDQEAPQREATLEATRALADYRRMPRGGGQGGLTQASIESNYRIWDKRLADATRHLGTLQSFKDSEAGTAEEQRMLYRLDHGVSEDILGDEIQHATEQRARFEAQMQGAAPSGPAAPAARAAAPAAGAAEAAGPPTDLAEFGEWLAKRKGWDPEHLSDEQADLILSSFEKLQQRGR